MNQVLTDKKVTKINQKYPRHTQKVLKGNYAASESAVLCHSTVIPAYPITPQTSIIEELSNRVSVNKFDATFINMDSEHSVFAAAMGAAMTGERVFTATSGQGLFYAHEVLHGIAHFRLPIVICNVGRPSIPWNIWSDQSDSISQRDTGWIQYYGESSQEVLDDIIQAYKISEELNIPVMVVLDAFYQSHTSENIWVPDQELVDKFLPKKKLSGSEIDLNNPKSFGGLVPPDSYGNFNHGYWNDIIKVEDLTNKVGKEFEKHFGRGYGAVEEININKDTKQILVTLSTITSTARGVIKKHPEVGILKIRLFKPFPRKSILKVLSDSNVDKNKCKIITFDKNFLGDSEGALMQELRRALYGENYFIQGVYVGLGGRDVSPSTVENIIETCKTNNDEIIWIDS